MYLFICHPTLHSLLFYPSMLSYIILLILCQLMFQLCKVVLLLPGRDLKVHNAEKYGWDPKRMLGTIVDIYFHLDSPEFAKTLANDERSFSKELFDMTIKRLDKAGIKTVDEMAQFRALGQRATDLLLQKLKDDEDYSDAPDNFMGRAFV